MSLVQSSVKMSFSIDELAKSSVIAISDQTVGMVTNTQRTQMKRKRDDDSFDLESCTDNSSDTTDCTSPSSYADDSDITEQPKKKSRTTFTNSQLMELEKYYSSHKYLLVEDRPVLAKKLKLNQTKIKWWFQNRRMKEKRQTKRNNYSGALDTSQFVSVGKSGQRLYNGTQIPQVPGYFIHQQYQAVPMFQSYICSPMLPAMYPGYTQQYYNGLSPQPVQHYRILE